MKLLSAVGHRRAAAGSAVPRQEIVLLAGKRIPECDVMEACISAAAIDVVQDLATIGSLEEDWPGWVDAGMQVHISLANRSDFASVRKAAFDAGAVVAEAGDASAVAFAPGQAHLVPPRLQTLVADFNGTRIIPRRRKDASKTPLMVWDAGMHTPEACALAVGSMHRWVQVQNRDVLTRWYDKGCPVTVIGLEGDQAKQMLTYAVHPDTLMRDASGRLGTGVASPAFQI
ncbi:hypothetical protein LG293_16280 (plasmid) [Citricoccus nitrophenolicus]